MSSDPGRGAAATLGWSIGRPSEVDAATLLSVYVAALILLPSRLTFSPLGGAGAPATVIGLLCVAWWTYAQLARPFPSGFGAQPVRFAFFVMLTCFSISYVAAMTRAIDAEESSSANLGYVLLLSWGGALLLANDGIPSYDRLVTLLRRLVFFVTLSALLGIFQFATGRMWVDQLVIPGLSPNLSLAAIGSRGSFTRPAGTAIHPIEFGALLCMTLPIAINLALVQRTRSWLRRWVPVGALLLAIVLSISRSAIICALVGIVMVAVHWPRRTRWIAGLVGIMFSVVVFVTIPGMIGTLTSLFTGISGDSSTHSRTDAYDIAFLFISRAPFFGRGFSTFLPKYQILDNQYLGLVIEVGLIGAASVVALICVAVWAAMRARRRADSVARAYPIQAIVAAIAAGAVGMAFYDGFGFPTATAVLFLLLGLAGAALRLSGPSAQD